MSSPKHSSNGFVARQGKRFKESTLALLHFWRTTLRSVYFPDEVNFYADTFIRFMFCLYYIPSIAVALALTHSALQRVVWVLVVPVAQDMERNPYHFSSLQTLGIGLWSISLRFTPFAALGLSLATVGHKTINCLSEAMLDSCTTHGGTDYPLMLARLKFIAEKRPRMITFLATLIVLLLSLVFAFQRSTLTLLTHEEPYVLVAGFVILFVQVLFTVLTVLRGASEEVLRALAGSLTTAADMFGSFNATSLKLNSISTRLANVASNLSSTLSPPSSPQRRAQGQAGTAARSPANSRSEDRTSSRPPTRAASAERQQSPQAWEAWNGSLSSSDGIPSAFDPPDVTTDAVYFIQYFLGDWWTQQIHYMRHIGFGMTCVFALLVAYQRGPLHGLTSGVLLLLCLNFPHLYGYMSASITSAVVRVVRSFRWLQRHPDAFLPCVVVAMPYQLALLNALLHFRHHAFTLILLSGVSVLLVARAIDLVREFDVSENGSVHWVDARSAVGVPSTAISERAPRLLNPSLSTLLEDAYEKRYRRPGIVSLDMTIDIQRMRIFYTGGRQEAVPLIRQQIIPYGAARRFLRDKLFYSYTYPRLLSLQSPGYLVGARYRTARVVLRGITITALIGFTLIVTGMVLQAAYPQLRPIPVRVSGPADRSSLTIDHIVLRMHLLSAQSRGSVCDAQHPETCASTAIPVGVTTAARDAIEAASVALAPAEVPAPAPADARGPDAAHAVFQWSNVSSSGGDFYPHLCERTYHGTTVWELSLLALAPYLFEMDEVRTLLDFMNTHLGSDWVIQPRYGTACVATDSQHTPTGWRGFYDFYSNRRDTSVIAVRGTDLFSFTDFLIDVSLFFESVLYQLMTILVPGGVVIPKDLIVNLIALCALSPDGDDSVDAAGVRPTWASLAGSGNSSLRRCQYNNFQRDFYADVRNHLTYIATQPQHPQHVVLTGHSLGGAVAAILGTQMGLEAVAFSSPGIALARKKFNVQLSAVHRYVMSVMSTNDIVPLLGEQGGEVHHVECLAAKRELCHAIEFMIGSLWRSCESVRDRFPSIRDVV